MTRARKKEAIAFHRNSSSSKEECEILILKFHLFSFFSKVFLMSENVWYYQFGIFVFGLLGILHFARSNQNK